MKAKELLRGLAERVSEFKSSDDFKAYLKYTAQFWRYSYCNQLLIWSQCKNATRVAGFKKWKIMGRWVKQGQTGIAILAPMTKKVEIEKEDGTVETIKKLWFKVVYVFDVEQTSGAELPALNWRSNAVSDNGGLEKLEGYCNKLGINVNYENIAGGAQGISKGGSVVIEETLTKGARACVLVHELAHELIHKGDKERQKSREVKETEAEAVAYVVTSALGIENGNSIAYLASWSDKNKLMESMKVISKTAKMILANIVEEEKRELNYRGW